MKRNYYDAPTEYADIAQSAAIDVRNNGVDILQRPKYKSRIKYTLIRELANHICFVHYLNSDEEIIYSTIGGSEADFPIIGEKITVLVPDGYIRSQKK